MNFTGNLIMCKWAIYIATTGTLLSLCNWPLNAQSVGFNGMVVSSSKPASEIGVSILKQGGNAVDASIATAFALAVTLPSAGNIGGGGFMVYWDHMGKASSIDFREKAPFAAHQTMYLDEDGKLKPDENHESIRAIGVPGTVAGLYLAHQKFGKLPWHALVQPAIDLAIKGFPMSWALYQEALWLQKNSKPGDFIHAYFNDENGNLTLPGKPWKQPALAKTLGFIRDLGPDGFYKGPVADAITHYMKSNQGILSHQDLASYSAIERVPIHGTYREYDVFSMGPPSSGGVALVEMLNMMETLNTDTVPFNSTSYVHVLTEVMRKAFLDRAKFMGDPDFNTAIPIEKLISKTYAKQYMEHLDWNHAMHSDSSSIESVKEKDHTTHFSVVDQEGNAVSLTYTLEDWYGSKLGVPGLGFIFNNEMGDFNPVPGITKSDGQIGTAPNTIAPGKRMLSSMTPTIVTKAGKIHLVIGSPGGRTIINTVFQTVLGILSYGMRIDQAIEAMKIHHQWLPDELLYENHLLSPDTHKALEKMGHRPRAIQNLGSLMGILYDKETKAFIGAADRSAHDGAAIAY